MISWFEFVFSHFVYLKTVGAYNYVCIAYILLRYMGHYMGTFVNADLFLHVSSVRNLHDSKPDAIYARYTVTSFYPIDFKHYM